MSTGVAQAVAPAAFYDGSRTLVNVPGIRDPHLLARFEYLATSARLIELHVKPTPGNFDAPHLRDVHRHLFRDVFGWAGEFRTGGQSRSGSTTPAEVLVGAALRQYRERDGFHTMDKEAFVYQFAQYSDRIHTAQPFAFGSERVLNVFNGMLARASGYYLDHSRIEPKNLAWAKALGQADDLTGWTTVLRSMAIPLRAREFTHALNRGDPNAALRQYPELTDAFQTLQLARTQLGRAVDEPNSLAQRRYQALRNSLQARLEKGLMPQPASERQVQRLLWSEKALQR